MATASARLVGRGSLYTLAAAGPMLTGVAITPVLTRALPVAEYGVVSLAIVFMQFTIGLLAMGLPLVITRHVFVESSADTGARSVAVTGSVLVLLGAGVLAGLGFALDAADGFDVAPALLLGLVAGGAGAGVAMAQAWAVAHDRAFFYILLALAVSVVAPALGTIAVFVGGRSATTYFVAAAGVFVLTDLVALGRLVGAGPLALRAGDFARSVRMGLPLVPHQLATSSSTGIAVLVAGVVLGVDASAHTQIGVYLGTVPLIIISALSYAWTPIILSAEEADRGARMTETAHTVAWLAAYGASGVALLAPWLLPLISSAEYDRGAMVPITASVALVAPVSVVFLAHSQLVVASGRTGAFAWSSPLALAVGAAAAVVLTSWWGLEAAGLGYLVTYAFLALSARVLALRRSPVRWKESVVVPALVTAACCCLAGALLPSTGPAILLRLAGGVVLAVAGGRLLVTVLRAREEIG